ncbi:sugar ABC transporter substrate-binding protein [Bosea sp. (in: a-proteobacteria)]|uniref:ABC transporter substrate-binding protein n=1 Tax=Bosea sp. (in: a-proteobacteria) TaxID=1871050 RepID=UPI0025C24BAF|nr:sugar ABC transporter substrate-binding protein [Bosea sp. (in: a-proteobacteria)]MBR3191255.1 sugar ABC transporter substrate-binding protein [Bosea sp. (in: a-proteobacteria)]
MTRTRLAFTAAALALAAGFLPGAAWAQGKVLKFVSWQKDERGVGDWWGSVIKEFEATHPGVKIEWTKVERGAYADTMTTLFAGGKPPDIVHLASFEFQKFADNGWLEPLDPYIKDAKLDLKGWAGQDTCTWNKQTVCTMMLYFGYIFAYNEELLKKEGLSVPKTYAEFLAAAQKLTKDLNGDGITDQFGTGHETKGGGGQYMSEMMNYTLDAGGRWTNDAGKVTINTPEMIEGLSRWKTIVKTSLTPRDLPAGEVRQMFADGKIAMKMDGPWLYPIIQKGKAKDQIKLGMVPFKPPVGGSSNVLGIAADAPKENKKLVWDFIALATSDKFQSSYATLGALPPPSPRADTSAATKDTPHFDLLVQATKAAADAKVDRIPKGLELQFNEFAKMVMEESQRMIIQDLDPKAVAATMQAKAEALQKQ